MYLYIYQSHQIHEKEPLLNTILLQSSQAGATFEAQAENSKKNFNNMLQGKAKLCLGRGSQVLGRV